MGSFVIFDVLAIAALFAGVMWLSAQVSPERPRKSRRATVIGGEPDSTVANAEVTVSWAAGTRADWDRHVRPVLAREFDNVVGGRRSASGSQDETGKLLFGPELWPLVDPADRFTQRLDRPGPGRDALGAILEKLEAA